MFTESNSHLTDEQLLLYADGELKRPSSRQVREHLESCWSCRLRFDDLGNAIRGLVRTRNEYMLPRIAPPPHPWEGLAPKFDAIDEARAHRSVFRFMQGLRASTSWIPRRPVVAAALVIFLIVLFISTSRQVVTADTLLTRAVAVETSALKKPGNPVIHQKLKVRRKEGASRQEQSVTLDVWNDMRHNRVRQSTGGWWHVEEVNSKAATRRVEAPAPEVVADLEEVYQSNRLDWRQPLSAVMYRAWRDSLGSKNDEIQTTHLEDGATAWSLTTVSQGPVSVGGVEMARLVIRSNDWHPVSQELRVKTAVGSSDFEVSELGYQVVSLDSVPAGFFENPEPVVTPAATPTVAAVPAPVTAPGPSDDEIAAAEMDARVALHQAGADFGDPIQIIRVPGKLVEVQGLVNTAERKSEILQALSNLPWVSGKIKTIEEASLESESSRQSEGNQKQSRKQSVPASVEPTPAEARIVADDRLPIQDQLTRYFTQQHRQQQPSTSDANLDKAVRGDIENLTNQALAISDAALSKAWALRRLAQRYTPDEINRLPQKSKRQLQGLVLDDFRNIEKQIGDGQQLLKPVLTAVLDGHPDLLSATTTTAVPGRSLAGEWPQFADPLFDTVNQVDRLTRGLFAQAGFPVEVDLSPNGSGPLKIAPPEKYVADLLAAYARLDAALPGLEKKLTEESLGNH
jgi:hypothetical protein